MNPYAINSHEEKRPHIDVEACNAVAATAPTPPSLSPLVVRGPKPGRAPPTPPQASPRAADTSDAMDDAFGATAVVEEGGTPPGELAEGGDGPPRTNSSLSILRADSVTADGFLDDDEISSE